MNVIDTIFPVVLPVPKYAQTFPSREKVAYLSRHARKALSLSSQHSGLVLSEPLKNADGSPQPSEGVYWSLTHKPRYVAGVVAQSRIGIDIEPLQPRNNRKLLQKVADTDEWKLAGEESWENFFRFWTAKEAVLKAGGVGLVGLSQCRIITIVDDTHLIIDYRNRPWQVEHVLFDDHIVSVVQKDFRVKWVFA